MKVYVGEKLLLHRLTKKTGENTLAALAMESLSREVAIELEHRECLLDSSFAKKQEKANQMSGTVSAKLPRRTNSLKG
jgi:hypothetical protein